VDARDKPGHDMLLEHGEAEMIAPHALKDRAQIGGRRQIAAFIETRILTFLGSSCAYSDRRSWRRAG